MRAGLGLLLLLVGCAGVDADIRRAEWKESLADIVKGRDRGLWNYAASIDKATTKVQPNGRYQYVGPAHVSQYMVLRSVRGLGGTRTPNAEYLAGVVDRLLHVAQHDPTAPVRATACLQLGRILLRLPVPLDEPPERVPGSDDRINEIAYDLAGMNRKLEKGEKVSEAAVIERLEALGRERPTRFLNAVQMVRILTVRPVAGSANPKLRETVARIAPVLVRDCILVALRDIACGDTITEIEPDPAPRVRVDATDVLARVGSPVALDSAVSRLWDPVDPAERDTYVRRYLVGYLGVVGGPRAFEVCLRRLDDDDSGVRFHAERALQRMTGVRDRGSSNAWRGWAEENPEWLWSGLPPAAE